MAYKQEVWDKVPDKKYPKQKRDVESPVKDNRIRTSVTASKLKTV